MENYKFNKNRVDCILIWGHGLKYFNDILIDIRNNKNFELLKIQKHKPRSIKNFVKEMYSYDYAPFWHLKNKTKYLQKTPKEVCFLFFRNLNPNEEYLDEGDFRHKESLTLKKFKEHLRDKYNPYVNNKRSHNHVIHATDSESQTDHMLHYLGYKDGVTIFESEHLFVNIPYYIKGYESFIIKDVNVDDVYCNTIVGDSWDDCNSQTIKLVDSPQYKGLSVSMSVYKNYISKFIGGPLQDDYNLERYHKVRENFEYLKYPNQTSFVLVKKVDDKYIVLDGLHRACIHVFNKNTKIKLCQLIK